MVATPNLLITLMPDNPLTPDTMFNEAVILLDWGTTKIVKNYTTTPPGSPTNGDAYLVFAGATGAWAGKDEQLAIYFDGWIFRALPQYTRVYNTTALAYYVKGASTWAIDAGAGSVSGIGRHTIGIPAGSMTPALTNGCASIAIAETSSNKINYSYLAFDQSTIEYAWFNFPSPKSYNASTMKFKVNWAHPSGGSAFGVVWRLQILSLADTNTIDIALGTAVDITDTGATAGVLYKSAESAAVTPSNTPAKGDLMLCRVARVATSGSDTLDIDAHLIGIEVYYDTDAGTDD